METYRGTVEHATPYYSTIWRDTIMIFLSRTVGTRDSLLIAHFFEILLGQPKNRPQPYFQTNLSQDPFGNVPFEIISTS